MGKDIKNMLKIASVYIGLVIGAGFASGREIITFFGSFGKDFVIGIGAMGIMLSAIGYLILKIIEENDIRDYSGFLRTVMGKKEAFLTELVTGTFLCVLFFAMVAAGGSLIYEAFGISRWIGSLALSVLSFITFVYGMEAVVKINGFLSPVMVIGTVVVCLYYYFGQSKSVFLRFNSEKAPLMIIFSAFVYVSYNIISAVSVFAEAEEIVKESRLSKFGAVLGGTVLAAMGGLIGIVLIEEGNSVLNFDIPMLMVLKGRGRVVEFIYIIVLLGAIITTAAANGFGAVKWLEGKVKINRTKIDFALCAVAFGASFLGFGGFTDRIYPVFGILGILEIFYILRFALKKN